MNIKISEEDNSYLTREVIDTDTGKKIDLPHGSGIDADWFIEDKENTYHCFNQFHCMDENGFYDGWIPFQLVLPKNNPKDFKLHFNGLNGRGWYRVYRYNLREYLEDLFAFELGELK